MENSDRSPRGLCKAWPEFLKSGKYLQISQRLVKGRQDLSFVDCKVICYLGFRIDIGILLVSVQVSVSASVLEVLSNACRRVCPALA